MSQFSRYHGLVGKLAGEAVAVASELPPGPADARLGLPAARVLLGAGAGVAEHWQKALQALSEAEAGSDPPLRTPGGQWRDVYHPLVVHLFLRSYMQMRAELSADEQAACRTLLAKAAQPITTAADAGTVSFRLWRALCLLEVTALQGPGDKEAVASIVNKLIEHTDPTDRTAAALHPQDESEPLDFWTYRELAGLHALARLADHTRQSDWQQRVEQIARFHLAHTQPDYTTYEPWALFAFASTSETAFFAEQQLHDATTHVAQGNASASLMVGLLLADSFDAMAGPNTNQSNSH